MGKDHDLLEAARNGQVEQIERILGHHKTKKVPLGPLSSLRKGPNPSCQDGNGETPLHYAALNGHVSAVQSLLRHEGCATIADNKGCHPIHLAAWNGNDEICKLLLTSGPSFASVNEQNHEGDTALHTAAQYGHTKVVRVLLESKADPTIRNNRAESPLDLAAQYGRLETVQVLLKFCPALVNEKSSKHSPLHLACRNGQKQVVQTLLEAGFDINTETETGTALHEAALFCKVGVVRLLVDRGINPMIKNQEHKTALGLFHSHRSATQATLDTVHILQDYMRRKQLPFEEILPTEKPSQKPTNLEVPPSASLFPTDPTMIKRAASAKQQPRSNIYELVQAVQDDNNTEAIYHEPPPPVEANGSSISTFPTNMSSSGKPASEESDDNDDDTYAEPPPPRPVPKPRSGSSVSKGEEPHSGYGEEVTEERKSNLYSKVNKDKKAEIKHDSVLSTCSSVDVPAVPPRDLYQEDTDDLYDVPSALLRKVPEPESAQLLPPPPQPGACNTSSYMNMGGILSQQQKETTKKSSAVPTKPPRRRTLERGLDGIEVKLSSSPKMTLGTSPRESYENVSLDTETSMDIIKSVQMQTSERDSASQPLGRSSVEFYELMSPKADENLNKKPNYPQRSKQPQPQAELYTNVETVASHSSATEVHPVPLSTRDSKNAVGETYENVSPQNISQMGSGGQESAEDVGVVEDPCPNKPPPTLEFTRRKKPERNVPLSPTGYVQPPTPDFPPPSPHTAELGIHEKINPQEKRQSRDIETITEPAYLQALGESSSSAENSAGATTEEEKSLPEVTDKQPKSEAASKLTGENKQIKVDNVQLSEDQDKDKTESEKNISESEKVTRTQSVKDAGEEKENLRPEDNAENVTVIRRKKETSPDIVKADANNPFSVDLKQSLIRGSIPGGQRKVVSQIYENVYIQPGGLRKPSKRRSAPGSTYLAYEALKKKDSEKSKGMGDSISEEKEGERTAEEEQEEDENSIDETEEWAQIADVLKSYGGKLSISDDGDCAFFEFDNELASLMSQQAEQKIQSVGDWLQDMGLGQYENTMVANGFDDMDFLGGTIIEDQDLIEIGITNQEHRDRIVEAAKTLTPIRPIGSKKLPLSVEEWLSSLRLQEYTETFLNNGFTSMDRVRKIWVLELDTVLGITTLGHRKRILASLGERPEEKKIISDDSKWNLSPLTGDKTSIPDEYLTTKQATDINLYKDYTSVKPNYQGQHFEPESTEHIPLNPNKKDTTEGSDPVGLRDDAINIRPPHLAHTQSPVKKWRHRPEVLIKGCCNYTAQYLGSCLVKDLQGIDSTKEGILKMKKSTDSIAKVPTIQLSISYKGVKFIDAKSRKVICEHEVSNIFCACQDADNLNYFAYITKDLQAGKHYCHVFSVGSTELGTEIILTLGEAFEVAYQVAMKEKAEESAAQFEEGLWIGSQ
ncbi:ankyrin repeat and sterile alpha motif domain-containing protein 1B isoform X2 [Lingula anatina]|uniref:Ankyrin repeat and sterile alpha motif domain-containing protein 1B isoform X2 n=1 Tax=Lingula anatina TaxID=7574 RepID=A0A1S3JGT9_LINAN|nr:ankyrin repeat and sterile alpha motif domain-containing protein 1B isoform X2 [Lingula anatina]|eukprot:XP_013409625.1 ankyrin repeat and sterile alpha motif domain-containing protein 1B isoform X2 [Lingula anatina]